MKVLNRGLALAVVGAGLAASPLIATQATAAEKAEPSLLQQMRNQSDASVSVTDQAATGAVGFVRTKGDLMPARSASDARTAAAKSEAYLDKYAGLFGARPDELSESRVSTTPFGWTVTFTQAYRGVPVWAGQLKAHVASNGDLTAVTGFAAPDIALDVTPARTAADAASVAVGRVMSDPPGADEGRPASTKGLRAASTDLVVYRTGLVKGEPGKDVLAYDVEVSNVTNDSGTIRDRVVLDANTLKPLNRYSMIANDLDRTLYTTDYDPETEEGGNLIGPIWQEGDPFPDPELDEDQNNLLASSAESYWMHMNTWGIDSYDDAGGRRITIHNRPDSCPNASWNGTYTSYCDGVYDDDTVAHEWGHAYTEYETGLIYQWQSGALNESYSDIWGETVDLLNGREDDGEGDLSVERTAGLCSRYTRGEIGATITAPASVAGECEWAVPFQHGPVFDKAGVTADVVAGTDAVEVDADDDPIGTNTDGCSPLTNPEAVNGKWVYVDRGACILNAKVKNAVNAGATGIVIGNVTNGAKAAAGGDFPIYGLMVDRAAALRIKSVGQVTMVVKDIDTAAKDQNSRWVLSEKSAAFGGAIRDMWTPTCYGDPGKVSDAEYKCSSDDNGGVHGNSGVPNHGYALLVDGGTYNGQTVTGLGFDKAANIYFYAQNYMGPTSDFVDHADSLEQACADLVGADIKQLSLTEDAEVASAEPITTADCAEVAKMTRAVELRLDPTVQCEWKPLLDKGEGPALCGEGFTSREVFGDTFDQGLGAWTKEQDVVFEGGNGYPWRTAAVYPGRDNVGRVAFGPTPDEGDCRGNDISSTDSITSPSVLMPAGKALRLSFDHYIATEAGYDGGNVKISVNGGEFAPIPTDAYVFNGPNAELEPEIDASGNPNSTNPLAGEEGFTGTNPGRSSGSWGTSQVNLEAAGAQSGDSVQIRFDLGRDGCGGVDGWYVDDVSITVCEDTNTSVSAVHVPEPSTFGQASRVDVTVAAQKGGVPTGTVDLLRADGTKLGSGSLADGKVSIALPADLTVGTHVLTATYAGNGGFKPSSGTVTVTVQKAATPPTPPTPGKADSSTKAKVSPKRPSFGNDFTVIGKVKAEGLARRSRVIFKIDGKRIGSRKINEGRAVMTVRRNYGVGKHKLVVVYRGTSKVSRSKDKVTFRIYR